MLKRSPSFLWINGKENRIPRVYCELFSHSIRLEGKSSRLQFSIICPVPQKLEENDFMDIFLNMCPDFHRTEQTYYYTDYACEESYFEYEKENFHLVKGKIEINYLCVRTFFIRIELQLRNKELKNVMCHMILYPLVKEPEEEISFQNRIPKRVSVTKYAKRKCNSSKPIEELCIEDFSHFPVWEYDLEYEYLQWQDETWVKPVHVENVFLLEEADIFVVGTLCEEHEVPCIFYIHINSQKKALSIVDGVVFIDDEYIVLEDFLPKEGIDAMFTIHNRTFRERIFTSGAIQLTL